LNEIEARSDGVADGVAVAAGVVVGDYRVDAGHVVKERHDALQARTEAAGSFAGISGCLKGVEGGAFCLKQALVQIFAGEWLWYHVICMLLNRRNDDTRLFVQSEAGCATHTWSRELLNNLPETADLPEEKSRAIICFAVGVGVNHGRDCVVGFGLGLELRKVR